MIMLARMLAMNSTEAPLLNSHKIDKKSEEFISILDNENSCNELFKNVVDLLEKSGLDISKKQFKAESETDILIKALILRLNS
jgi:hypothetical protein